MITPDPAAASPKPAAARTAAGRPDGQAKAADGAAEAPSPERAFADFVEAPPAAAADTPAPSPERAEPTAALEGAAPPTPAPPPTLAVAPPPPTLAVAHPPPPAPRVAVAPPTPQAAAADAPEVELAAGRTAPAPARAAPEAPAAAPPQTTPAPAAPTADLRAAPATAAVEPDAPPEATGAPPPEPEPAPAAPTAAAAATLQGGSELRPGVPAPPAFVDAAALRPASEPGWRLETAGLRAAPELAAASLAAPRDLAGQITLAVVQATEPQVEIRLDPPELGRVQIRLNPTEGGLQATVLADRPETQDFLRRNAEALIRDLTDAGYAQVSLDFAAGGEAPPREAPADERRFAARFDTAPAGARAAAAEPPRRATAGGLDIRL